MPPRLSTEEIKLRGTLLGRDRELLNLHKSLVRGGLLTEEEFWQSREAMLEEQRTLLRQKKPPTFDLGGNIKAVGDANEQKIIFTAETIEAILGQTPLVKQAHSDLVPERMSEKEFWTCYVQSKFFLQNNKNDYLNSSLNSDSIAENPLNRYFKEDSTDEGQASTPLTSSVLSYSRLVDIASTTEDHQNDINDRLMRHLRSQESEKSLSLIKKFNNHSLKIIQATTAEGAKLENIEEAIKLNDLEVQVTDRPEELNVIPENVLRLKYLESTASSTKEALSEEKRNEFIEKFRECHQKIVLHDYITQNVMIEHKSLDELLIKAGGLQRKDNVSDKGANVASLPIPDDISAFRSNSMEILRHFWDAFPPGRDVQKKSKLIRMTTIIEQLLIKSNELIKSKIQLADQILAGEMLGDILTCLEHALTQYNQNNSKSVNVT